MTPADIKSPSRINSYARVDSVLKVSEVIILQCVEQFRDKALTDIGSYVYTVPL